MRSFYYRARGGVALRKLIISFSKIIIKIIREDSFLGLNRGYRWEIYFNYWVNMKYIMWVAFGKRFTLCFLKSELANYYYFFSSVEFLFWLFL
jgi:hypothetical protein